MPCHCYTHTHTHTIPEKFLIRSRVPTPALGPTFCESKVHSVKKLEETSIRDRSCVKDGWCMDVSPVYRAQSLCVCFSVQCTVRLCSFVMSLIVPGGRAQIWGRVKVRKKKNQQQKTKTTSEKGSIRLQHKLGTSEWNPPGSTCERA